MAKNKLLRMDNVGIVVESLDDAISFFTEIGLKLEGRATVEGERAGRITGRSLFNTVPSFYFNSIASVLNAGTGIIQFHLYLLSFGYIFKIQQSFFIIT